MKTSDNDRERAIRNSGYFHEQLKLMATEKKTKKNKTLCCFLEDLLGAKIKLFASVQWSSNRF